MSNVFASGGVAGACAAAVDWSRTAVGPIESWPASLRTILGVIFTSRHPMFLYWGPQLTQFYNDGYLPSFGTGKHPTAMGQPGRECWAEIWPIIGHEVEGVLERGIATWHEDQLVAIHRNGGIEDVYWTYGFSPVPSEAGIGGVLVVVTETTSRVNAVRRLMTARLLGERTRASSSDSELFVGMTTDLPFVLVFAVERGALRVTSSTGLSADALARVEPFFRANPYDRCTDALLSDLPLVRADLAPHIYFVPLVTPAQPIATAFVAFGINPRIPLDDEYRAHLAQLANLLADAMAQAQLRAEQEASRRQLAISDRMASVGTLAAGMAHEINNPLTFVTANLDMILDELRELAGGSPSSRFRELESMVVDARTGAERVGKIVRGLKTFSRTGDERRSRLELKPVIELAINLSFNEIRGRARLVRNFGTTSVVEADDARLGHVFINLLVNAAHAIPEGNPAGNEIEITTFTDVRGRAVVDIRDTGAGIPDQVVGRIFEPFFTTKPQGIGTGLGLSICHNIVTALGGEITVSTELGRGSTFRVALLPAGHETKLAEDETVSRDNRVAAILIVEDEPAIRIVLARALAGHDLTIVSRVADALTAIDSGKCFDVILSDLMLPELTGMDFYDQIQRSHPAMAERMVFVTGGAATLTGRAFLERVPNERLEKPFSVRGVRELVRRFVAPAEQRKEDT